MSKIALLVLVVILTSCGKSEPTDAVNTLVARPDRLRKVEKECSKEPQKAGDLECNAASEARHRLFMGNGPQYTPPKNAPKF